MTDKYEFMACPRCLEESEKNMFSILCEACLNNRSAIIVL